MKLKEHLQAEVKRKYKIDVELNQIASFFFKSLECTSLFIAEGIMYPLKGQGYKLRRSPATVFFPMPKENLETFLFKKRIESQGENLELDIDCVAIVNGNHQLNFSLHTSKINLVPSHVVADYAATA